MRRQVHASGLYHCRCALQQQDEVWQPVLPPHLLAQQHCQAADCAHIAARRRRQLLLCLHSRDQGFHKMDAKILQVRSL